MTEPERKTYRMARQIPPNFTVEELTQHCLREGLDPETTVVSGGHFVWQHEETDEELQGRLDREAASQARHREWVKARYLELFGGEA